MHTLFSTGGEKAKELEAKLELENTFRVEINIYRIQMLENVSLVSYYSVPRIYRVYAPIRTSTKIPHKKRYTGHSNQLLFSVYLDEKGKFCKTPQISYI